MITLSELFPPAHVVRLRLGSQAAVINDLAGRAASLLGMKLPQIAAALAEREALGSTGVGNGIAVPHARIAALDQPRALFARLDRPIDWRAVDGKPVDLVFMLISPKDDNAGHLQALATVTRRLRDVAVAKAIRQASTPEAIRDALVL